MDTGEPTSPAPDSRSTRPGVVTGLLLFCVLLVVFWQIMAARARSPSRAFRLTAREFDAFTWSPPGWQVQRLPVTYTPAEPNLLAFRLERRSADGRRTGGPVRIRLLHGYNMRDCMRLKGYRVDLIADTRLTPAEAPAPSDPPWRHLLPRGRQVQVWRLTARNGERSYCITGMLRASDFEETPIDIRRMAFPRVAVVDDAGWVPQGLRWSSLRHPIANFRRLMRLKWNNARCDLLTFLHLRPPAWASEDLLTLEAETKAAATSEADRDLLPAIFDAYVEVLAALQEWRRRTAPKPTSFLGPSRASRFAKSPTPERVSSAS